MSGGASELRKLYARWARPGLLAANGKKLVDPAVVERAAARLPDSRPSCSTIADSEIEKRSTERSTHKNEPSRRSKSRPAEWEPFRDAPGRVQRRFRKQLARAHQQPMTAIKLFCIQCMGYSEAEPRHCAATTCPLYAFNRWTFARIEGPGAGST